jgi:hypothetical protein
LNFVKCILLKTVPKVCRISGSHSSGYEEFCILGYSAM